MLRKTDIMKLNYIIKNLSKNHSDLRVATIVISGEE